MTTLIRKVFPKRFVDRGAPTQEVLDDLVMVGLLDPDRAKASITLLS